MFYMYPARPCDAHFTIHMIEFVLINNTPLLYRDSSAIIVKLYPQVYVKYVTQCESDFKSDPHRRRNWPWQQLTRANADKQGLAVFVNRVDRWHILVAVYPWQKVEIAEKLCDFPRHFRKTARVLKGVPYSRGWVEIKGGGAGCGSFRVDTTAAGAITSLFWCKSVRHYWE